MLASPADLLAVSQTIEDAMQPGNFFAVQELALSWIAARSETIAWEIFRGRLLDGAHTRATRTFLSWHVVQTPTPAPAQGLILHKPASDAGACGVAPAQAPSSPAGLIIGVAPAQAPSSPADLSIQKEQPLLSVKLDVHERRIHVTRGILCHAWEGYDAGGAVIDSREVIKWTHELVGTIALAEYANVDDVRDELICLLWQAVVGTSRLPLTSLEAPLPAFVFGQLHYLYRPNSAARPSRSWNGWLARGLRMRRSCAWRETVKHLEFMLRRITPENVPRLVSALVAACFGRQRQGQSLDYFRLFRSMFNDASLSPYTGFVDNALAVTEKLGYFDLLPHLLLQIARHLTAYDLVTFHHRGANYPDALLLDAVLKAYLRHLEANPALFTTDEAAAQMRRRALRQGILIRRHYEGHRVPDAPTSPGENARVMPAAHPRVPDEQIAQPNRRTRRLFAHEPLESLLSEQAKRVFAQSIRDLEHAELHVELGLGIFIDRPLGYGKAVGGPDQTPLLAHEAFSRSVARRRLDELRQMCAQWGLPFDGSLLELELDSSASGLAHYELADCPRPVAALADVRRVADDFVILRTLPIGLADCLRHFDWRPLLARYRLRFLAAGEVRWCVQAIGRMLILADIDGRRRLEMRVDLSQGYVSRAGVELPRAGLQVLALWEDGELIRHDLAPKPWSVPLAV